MTTLPPTPCAAGVPELSHSGGQGGLNDVVEEVAAWRPELEGS